MPQIHKSVCPLNCYDSCGLLVEKEGDRLTRVSGDPEHPLTKGFICAKGRKLLERVYSPDRIKHPLKKTSVGWQRITWAEALETIAQKLTSIKEQDGSTAVLHHYDYATNGILKDLDRRFFNAYGGVTRPVGSLCWGSGYAAQEYDFGALQAPEWDDCLNSKTIILWGRDPASTNIHLVSFLKEAKEKGAQLITISPVRNRTSKLADLHIAPKPGTDGALALSMAYVILEERLLDLEFVAKHVHGFAEYAKLVKEYSPRRGAEITGVGEQAIISLARRYATAKPACIFFGYGMQRYANGGQTVRAIDALAAITGNIGLPGGGAAYAHQNWRGLLKDIKGENLAAKGREFPYPIMAQCILEAQDPPIKAIFVTRSNPVSQHPNTAKVKEAFNQVDFKVVIDFFLTDTAEMADLVLPCTSHFETDNVVCTSWNNYLAYAPKLIEPLGEARPEPEIFSELATMMGLEGSFEQTPIQWLEYALEPLQEYGINLESLKERAVRNPKAPRVAWENRAFETPTGKVELYSEKAKADGLDPLPSYRETRESAAADASLAREYPLHFLTPHHKDWIHSQFSNMGGIEETSRPTLDIHPEAAMARGIRNLDRIVVESSRGQMIAVANLTTDVRPDVVQVIEGWWIKEGGGVNFLTPDFPADMGNGTPFYDCLCQVRKVHLD